MLKAKFITDTIPPVISGSSISGSIISPNGDGVMDTHDHAGDGHRADPLRLGRAADESTGSSARRSDREAPMGRAAAFTWDGKNSAGAVVPDGSYRITIWTADASNNRASASKVVTVDRRPAAVSLTSAPRFISPNGDGHSDRTTISMRADEWITGSARMLDSHGVQVRKWAFTKATAGSWVWDGRDSAGRTVARRSLHAPRAGRRSGRQRDRPRSRRHRRPDDPVGDLVAHLVHPEERPDGADRRSASSGTPR